MRTLHGEWTKLRTLPSTGWLLLLAIAGTVGLGFAVIGSLEHSHCPSPCAADLTKLSLAGIRLGQVAVVVLAVLAVTAEYSTRTIQPTLMAVPRRFPVVVSKLAVLAFLGTLTGVLAVAGSLIAGRVIPPRNGFTQANGFAALSLDDPLTRRAALGAVVYIGLIALLAAGLGLMLRDTASAVAAALAMLYAAPVVATFVSDPKWQHRIHRFSPMDAGMSIQATRDLAAQHIGPWAGLGLLALYAATAVVAGLLVFQFRDPPKIGD
jgi:ABC-2 type transport system permease protein